LGDEDDELCELGGRVPDDCSSDGKTVTCSRYTENSPLQFEPSDTPSVPHHGAAFNYRQAADRLVKLSGRYHHEVDELLTSLFLEARERDYLLNLAAKSKYAMLEAVSRIHYVASRLE
jgi:hypothetical protein